jgi:RNA polymerase sigma-70 factor (ECF subfamily)
VSKITDLWHGSSSKAFEALTRQHLPVLHRLAFRFTGDPHEAEDLVQDLLLRLYPRRNEVLALDKPRPWMVRVLYRMSVDRWRQRRREHLRLVDLPEAEAAYDLVAADPAEEPPAVLERTLSARRLERALAQLSVEHRAVVVLHDVEGMPLQELEAVLEVPQGTLKSRLHRARNRLRELLHEETSAAAEACMDVKEAP